MSAVACHLSAGNIKSALLRLCQDKTKLGTRQLARCVSGLRQKPSETLVPEQTYSLQTSKLFGFTLQPEPTRHSFKLLSPLLFAGQSRLSPLTAHKEAQEILLSTFVFNIFIIEFHFDCRSTPL